MEQLQSCKSTVFKVRDKPKEIIGISFQFDHVFFKNRVLNEIDNTFFLIIETDKKLNYKNGIRIKSNTLKIEISIKNTLR